MPCVSLGQKKVYRAAPVRKHDRKIHNTQPAGQTEKLRPETKELVESAQAAVEVMAPSPVARSVSAPKKVKSDASQAKSSKKLSRGLKKLKTSTLRRSAVKAARRTKNSPRHSDTKDLQQANATESKARVAQSQTSTIRLKDGDHIQIRPHRSRPNANLTSPDRSCPDMSLTTTARPASAPMSTTSATTQPSLTPATTQKPARALKKNTKSNLKPKRRLRLRRPSRAELINAESRLGSMIFGAIPEGHRREFFHDRENIWIWHESWTDSERHARQLTVRYEVRPSGVYKKLSAGKYFKLEGAELENFRKATRTYLRLIKQYLYNGA